MYFQQYMKGHVRCYKSSRKVRIEGYFFHKMKKHTCLYVSYGPLHTIHLSPPFPCLRKKKKKIHSKVITIFFPYSHNCILFHNALPPPPLNLFPAPHPRSGKVQRIHTNEKALKNKENNT
ncbi:hypothetical protein AMECASPLE_007918 [Ameca splendens]|uniref:Uncharacterized protein n=1 Tax=Ameca splendens TaxID=208324 RepID=A0ABV0ZAX9_9TELE